MGINEGSLNPYLRRRIPAFIDSIKDVAETIYLRDNSEYSEDLFKNFLDRAIFYSIRDVVEDYDLSHHELRELEIILLREINKNKDLLQTIKQIYISKFESI